MRSLFFFLILVILIGCSKYQYVTINSDLNKTKRGQIVMETDSIIITYNFSGIGGPVRFQLFNKLNIPIYISWQQSSLIINGRSWAYHDVKTRLNAPPDDMEIKWTERDIGTGIYNTQNHHPRYFTFVPPQAFIDSDPIHLTDNFYKLYQEKLSVRYENSEAIRYKTFTKDNTPLCFRSYITLSTTQDFDSTLVFDNQFWAEEIAITMVAPNDLLDFKGRDDVFHVAKPSGFGLFAATIGILGYLAITLAGN